jgi:Na+/H+ antiporter NhaD/arsenite permease-like protein
VNHSAPVVPLVGIVPFVSVLAAIAIFPLVAPHFWERNRNKGLVMALFSLPIAVWLGGAHPSALTHAALEYVSFLCLLSSLFIVAGGIHLGGDLQATPRNNTILLGVGALLASFIGTTGASMLMIRLLLRTNSERKNTVHLAFFFILVVSNCGGLLTPLGDPPLFLGFLRGVPFLWTFRLFPVWLLANAYLLTVFFFIDRKAYRNELKQNLARDLTEYQPLNIEGRLNIVWLLGIVFSVFLPTPMREASMVAAATLSLVTGSREPRRKNEFSFAPIVEVAVLFAGIFVTMVPALAMLERNGPALGLVAPYHFFLVTGALSSVLDNAPTYLTFLTTAQSTASNLGSVPEVVGVPANYLAAISIGAVLMGANTYIGNGPNFMVKAIADATGYTTPSFGRYAAMAIFVLSPVYLIVALTVHLY